MTNSKNSSSIAFVIFGITGDLTTRKLAPALYALAKDGELPEDLHIIGISRSDWDNEALRSHLGEAIRKNADDDAGGGANGRVNGGENSRTGVDSSILDSLLSRMHYIRSSFEDSQGYRQLSTLLEELGLQNRLYYLATPPAAFPTIVTALGEHQLANSPNGWTRIVIEKPYGRDLDSARELDKIVHQVFTESQVYRIDHYLGKETVQNILVLRFANGVFEHLWNRNYIDHVQIVVAETVGVGSRADYYESAGVIRDIFQNHLLQLLALTTMEAPYAFQADAIRDEKLKVLHSLHPLRGQEAIEHTFRAQYGPGVVDGEQVRGYLEEDRVRPDSTTETYLAACLHIDNWRWADVPFYIRSGKRMARRVTEISIHFRQVPLPMFGWRNRAGEAPNILILNIQPEEGITLTFSAKAPGPRDLIKPVNMHFDYVKTFGVEPPEAYQRLLLEVIQGDATLFTRADEVEAAWTFTTEILHAWQDQPKRELPHYPAGSWGPDRNRFTDHLDVAWRAIPMQ